MAIPRCIIVITRFNTKLLNMHSSVAFTTTTIPGSTSGFFVLQQLVHKYQISSCGQELNLEIIQS